MDKRGEWQARFDVVVVGAGFAGLYMLYRLRSLGLSAHVFESGGDVGGTWYWNRYPGARCDIESILYSFSFSPELEQEWEWTERYATQPEILRYLSHVADRFDLRRDISFNTQVIGATYCEKRNLWTVETNAGARVQSRFLITATGAHSARNMPAILGLESFQGRILHTAFWPHGPVHFENQQVGVIGTGSSGIQVIPELAKQARHLTVFQRTPNYSLPAHNRRLEPGEVASVKRKYRLLRELAKQGVIHGGGDVLLTPEQGQPIARRPSDVGESERRNAFEAGWKLGGVLTLRAFSEGMRDPETNTAAADFIRSKIHETVKDAAVADKLCPKNYPIGAKRICLDTGYYETFNRPNVTLIDIREDPISRVIEKGILLASGEHIDLDSLVLATGFDMVTGPLIRLNITGLNGVQLADYWGQGPRSYLGIGVAGFPNLFTITGPLSPSAFSNVVVSIEQHVEWIAECLSYLRRNNFDRIDVDRQCEQEWQQTVLDTAEGALQTKTDSWYIGANIPGKPRTILVYTGGEARYREICEAVRKENYRGFILRKADGQ